MNRRQLLQWAIAGSATTAAAGAWARGPSGRALLGSTQLPIELFIFDSRFPAAQSVAKTMRERGIRVAAMAGDLTRLWYDDLDLRWKRAPMTLAGVTTGGGLFVLETLAADRGMRVLHRGPHATSDGVVLTADDPVRRERPYSWVIAPRSLVAARA